MTRTDLLAFLRDRSLAVEATVSPSGAPQAAVIGYVVNDNLEVFFDTSSTSRKYHNLRADPRVAFAIGWDGEVTVQYEGIAEEPGRDELARWKTIYFERFPDGRAREQLPDIAYFQVRPAWIRRSDFSTNPPRIDEVHGDSLRALLEAPLAPDDAAR